jgi:hypothetical protein
MSKVTRKITADKPCTLSATHASLLPRYAAGGNRADNRHLRRNRGRNPLPLVVRLEAISNPGTQTRSLRLQARY